MEFRDLLRWDRTLRNQYADVKRALAQRFAEDRTAYRTAKNDFIRHALESRPPSLAREARNFYLTIHIKRPAIGHAAAVGQSRYAAWRDGSSWAAGGCTISGGLLERVPLRPPGVRYVDRLPVTSEPLDGATTLTNMSNPSKMSSIFSGIT